MTHKRPTRVRMTWLPIQFMIPMGIGLTLAMVAIASLALMDARRSERLRAEQEAGNLAVSLERDIGRAVETLDLSMRAAREGMKQPGLDALPIDLRQSLLFDGAIAAEGFGGVFITDANGNVVYDSLGRVPRSTFVGDRDYFRQARDQMNAGLIISPPLRSRADGKWTIGLARRLGDVDGQFAGVVVGGLKLDYIQGLFQPLEIGKLGSIALTSVDGILEARRPYDASEISRNVTAGVAFRRMSGQTSGSFVSMTTVDGVERLYSFRRVGSLPLVISVGLATQEIYADWMNKASIITVALAILFLIGAAMGGVLRVELRRRADAELAARQAERAAKDSEQRHADALARLDTLFQSSSDAMFISRLDDDGSFVYESVNPVWERLTGISADAAIGRSPSENLPAETAQIAVAGWQDCVRENRPAYYHHGMDRPGGREEWEVVVSPVALGKGPIRRLIGVGRDITTRQRLEAELRQVHRMEAVGQLTTGIAHDFNNILQAILASLEVLEDQTGLDEDGRACVTEAAKAAQRGAVLTHQLLAFSRKQPLAPSLLDPAEVVASMGAQLSRTLGGRVRVECVVGDDVWPVQADAGQLDNCLYNLAINARDAMRLGGVLKLVTVNRPQSSGAPDGLPAGDCVEFSVIDEGTGMTPEVLARAQEPFFTTKPVGEGTGLGLSMVDGFARQSSGGMKIESVPGQGTTVSLWLPRASGVVEKQVPVAGITTGRGTVLLVDDETSVRQTLSLLLKRAGFSVVAADSGEAAMDLLEGSTVFELLVTDQSMPGLSGAELIAEAARLRPGMPTMLITGYDRVQGLEQLDGRVTILRKPFGRGPFIGQVRALIDPSSSILIEEHAKGIAKPGAIVVPIKQSRFEAASE